MRLALSTLLWPSLLWLGACVTLGKESPRIRQLLDPATRMQALYEMTDQKEKQSLAEFTKEHANLQVTRCPQRDSAPSFYIVSHTPEWHSLSDTFPGDYEIPRPEKLFQARRPAASADGQSPARMLDQVLSGYFENGRKFDPFGGDNMITDGYLFDVNGDGVVEKLDTYHSGVSIENATVEVLCIETAETKPRTLLSVVINWHSRDADLPENRWSWDVRPSAAAAGWQVVLFPSTGSADKPQAVYEWDATQKRFTGPAGGKGSHFARLPAPFEEAEAALKKLHAQGGLAYPIKQFTPVSETLGFGPASGSGSPALPPARPYVKQSRQSLTHAELFTFMGLGRRPHHHLQDHQENDRIPDGFWTMAPQAAALELVDINRSPRHHSLFQLAVEDRDGQKPPESGTLHLSHSSSFCYNARVWEIFISFRPGDSWLAYGRTVFNGAARYNALHDGPFYDFEWHDLKDADARHIAHTLWWLDRVRSRNRLGSKSSMGMSMSTSTADGSAHLKLRSSSESKPLVNLQGQVLADEICHRWNDDYKKETALNFACLLIEKALPPRWGDGPEFLHKAMPVLRNESDDPPDPTSTEARRQSTLMMLHRFMDRLEHPPSLPPVFLKSALHAAGEMGLSAEDILHSVESHVLPPTASEIELRDLEKRIQAAGPMPLLEPFPPSLDFLSDTPPKKESAEELRLRKKQQQHQEDESRAWQLRTELEDNLSYTLRDTLPSVRRQLAARDDVAALKTWASSQDLNADWAMRRLQEVDMSAYVSVLSADLLKLKKPDEAARAVALFKELCTADPAAAAHALGQLKGELAKACTAIAPPAMIGEKADVDSLLAALTEKSPAYWDKKAILAQLVPSEDPMRHRDPRIEKTLLKEMMAQVVEFGGHGDLLAEALSRREGALRYWDTFKDFHQKKIALYSSDYDVLCRLAQTSSDPKHMAELRAILLSQLQRTHSSLTPAFASLYALDLRDTAPDLARVATFDATDVEGQEAYTAGNTVRVIKDRFHMPRHILALWDEPDATTTARMLIAWSIHHAADRGLFADRVLAQAQKALTAPGLDHAVVREFLDWCLNSADATSEAPMSAKTRQTLQSWRAALP
ncbi:hypothetical protein [Prosthecobacter sp.]|uniref:hypothetical protein n=1 Tax=Prosthecobacter sp. TaxID=1965333 RepID=UPI003782EA5E